MIKEKKYYIEVIVNEKLKKKIDLIVKSGVYINLQDFISSALRDRVLKELPKFFDEVNSLNKKSKSLNELRIIYSEIEETEKDRFVHVDYIKEVLLKWLKKSG